MTNLYLQDPCHSPVVRAAERFADQAQADIVRLQEKIENSTGIARKGYVTLLLAAKDRLVRMEEIISDAAADAAQAEFNEEQMWGA